MHNGQTLLQHAIKNALCLSDSVIVVLGANYDAIAHTVLNQPVTILHNQNWPLGMASSISMAVKEAGAAYPGITAILFLLCDQPFADAELLGQLTDTAKNSDKGIVASAYNHTLGVPALFKQAYFAHLLRLKGEEGAKKLLMQHADDVARVAFPQGSTDIDTRIDWEKFNQK